MGNTVRTFTSNLHPASLFLAATLLVGAMQVSGQNLNLPLHHNFQITTEQYIIQSPEPIHTGFKPILSKQFQKTGFGDTVLWQQENNIFKEKPKNLILRKLFFEEFFDIQTTDFTFKAYPLFYLEMKKQGNQSFTINTRGLEIKGRLGNDIAYYTSFRENQAFFPAHIDSFVSRRLTIPGQGAHKSFRDSGYDYSTAEAYISYSPSDFLNLQLGHGNHFIGHGYRSLLLSDNTFNYPYLKLRLAHKGWQYQSFIAQQEDFQKVYYDYHRRKHTAVNYLSYNFQNRIEVGFFEGIIYRSLDTTNYNYNVPLSFFTPLPVLRSLVHRNSNKHYLLTGLSVKLQILKYAIIYGQTAFSPAQGGNAFQAGIKMPDVLPKQLSGHSLFLQAEYNTAKNRLFAHPDNAFQSWSHYNREAAHPAGTNFSETVLRAHYSYNRLGITIKRTDLNQELNRGQIFLTNSEINFANSTEKTKITYLNFQAAYTINPAWQLQITVGTEIRKTPEQSDQFMFFGLQSALHNFQTDYI